MQMASAAGFYGKLPCKGDFLQRRVAQEFVDTWDAWLQQCLLASREQLQERWLDAYLTSPVWRFAIGDGVCGSGAYAGVMLPSVDRVGRYFPLTLVAQLNAHDCLLDLASDAVRQWFDSAEALALAALQAHDLDLALFDEQVAALVGPVHEPDAAESAYLRELMQDSPFARRVGQWQVPIQKVHSLQRAINVFACRELERTLRPLAIWWTDGSDAVTPCWLCSRGLPSPGSFAAMIAGEWERFSWESLGPAAAAPQLDPLVGSGLSAVAVDGLEQPSGADLIGVAATQPSIAITAYHSPVNRRVDSAQRSHFVSRPDVGLWGLSCSGGSEAGAVESQTVADVLQDIQARGSLTASVEEIRRALELIRRRATVHAPDVEAGTVVFLMSGDECAVICAGQVQAVRVRSSEVTTIEGTSQWARGDDEAQIAAHASLLDLLAAPSPLHAEPSVVHYDRLHDGDLWILSGVLMSDSQSLAGLPALLAEHRTFDAVMLSAVGRLWERETGVVEQNLPLMLVAAVPSH